MKIQYYSDINSDYTEWIREDNGIYVYNDLYYTVNNDRVDKQKDENDPTDQRIANSVSVIKNLQGVNANRLVGHVKGQIQNSFPINPIENYGQDATSVITYGDLVIWLDNTNTFRSYNKKTGNQNNLSESGWIFESIFGYINYDETNVVIIALGKYEIDSDKSLIAYYVNKETGEFLSSWSKNVPVLKSVECFDNKVTYLYTPSSVPGSIQGQNLSFIQDNENNFYYPTNNMFNVSRDKGKSFTTYPLQLTTWTGKSEFLNGYVVMPAKDYVHFGLPDGSYTSLQTGTYTWRGCWYDDTNARWIFCGNVGRVGYTQNRTSYSVTGTNTAASYAGGQKLAQYHVVAGEGYVNRCTLAFAWTATNYCSTSYLSGYTTTYPIVNCTGYNNVGYIASTAQIWTTTTGQQFTQKITTSHNIRNILRIRVGLGNTTQQKSTLWICCSNGDVWYVPDVTLQTWTVIKLSDGFKAYDILYDKSTNTFKGMYRNNIYTLDGTTFRTLYDVQIHPDGGYIFRYNEYTADGLTPHTSMYLQYNRTTAKIDSTTIKMSPDQTYGNYINDYYISGNKLIVFNYTGSASTGDGYVRVYTRNTSQIGQNFAGYTLNNTITLNSYEQEITSGNNLFPIFSQIDDILYVRTYGPLTSSYKYYKGTISLNLTDWEEITNPGQIFDRIPENIGGFLGTIIPKMLSNTDEVSEQIQISEIITTQLPQNISNIQTQDNTGWFYLSDNNKSLKYNPYEMNDNVNSIYVYPGFNRNRILDYYWDGKYLILVMFSTEEGSSPLLYIYKRNSVEIGQDLAGFDRINVIDLSEKYNIWHLSFCDISKKGDYLYFKLKMDSSEFYLCGTLEKELSDLQPVSCNPDTYELFINEDIYEPDSDEPYFIIKDKTTQHTQLGKIPWTKFEPLNSYGSDTMLINGLVRNTESQLDGKNVSLQEHQTQEFWENMGYDFTNIWVMDTTTGLPTLRNNPES